MITVEQAERSVWAAVGSGLTEECSLTDAHERVLRAPVLADRPSPPFDRVMMDGFALDHSAWDQGRREFVTQASVAAGHVPPALESPESAIEVMTGGVLPSGCDAVVPVEWCEVQDGRVRVDAPRVVGAGLYVHSRGSDGEARRIVLEEGTRLDAPALAIAATAGATTLTVTRRPRIFLLTTGDEVVDADAVPEDWQIRGSHEHALRALFQSWGPCAWRHEHANDDRELLSAALRRGLDFADVLLTVGGVSRGKWDLVPDVLDELGVEQRLHRVAQRPGKPIWFGVRAEQLVFGLPGNPVSALCSARRYVWPALDQLSGLLSPARAAVALAESVVPLSDAVRYVPVRLADGVAHPLVPMTSGSLHALVGSHGFVQCPVADREIPAGTTLPYFGWDR